jgi:phosphatidylglycerol:prolipoprotein diacylglycerol transferase
LYPILIEWGPLLVPSWHALFALGAIAGFLLFSRLASQVDSSLTDHDIGIFFLINYLGGYFGARITSIIIEQRTELHGFNYIVSQLFSLGPMTFYGGVIGGIAVSTVWFITKERDPRNILDAAIPSLMLGLFFGRIGCFLNGDDFGKPIPLSLDQVEPWWAVTLPNLGDGIPRYPVQIFEAIVALLLCMAGVALIRARKLLAGYVGLAILAGYAFSRFLLELLRADPRGWIIENLLSPSQFISILVLIGTIILAWKWQGARDGS